MKNALVLLIPLLPLLGFVITGLFGRRLGKSATGMLASTLVLLSFVCAATLALVHFRGEGGAIAVRLFSWISLPGLSVPMGFLLDPLSLMMVFIITGVGFLIHVYSIGYMREDEGVARFFSYLNLFTFFMLVLVLADNFVVMFIGWEGVGLCSYLLIGFWFKNSAFNGAAVKAFVVNRIGDAGFLLGIFLMAITFGSLSFSDVFARAPSLGAGAPVLTLITLFLFIGAAGKSAQIPLYTWLPDAMAGPTPVSALIHAATMVTAGVYLVIRSNALYALAPVTLSVIAAIGLATAIWAGLIALTQRDIKKVLTYSTVSQLGFMFLALGMGAWSTGFFHVFTHAFFKALLFLGAGSVIHALSGEQDLRRMGGLRKALPVTYVTMLAGTLAIAGIPPFAGFFSKDEIFAKVFEQAPALWAVALAGAFITSFYMFRLFFLVFHGEFRGDAHARSQLHESPKVMTVPLMLLAVGALVAGFAGMPELFGMPHFLSGFLSPVTGKATGQLSHGTEWMLMGASVATGLLAFALAWARYGLRRRVPANDASVTGLARWSLGKFYIDELYDRAVVRPLFRFSTWLHDVLDRRGIDGAVGGIAGLSPWLGQQARLLQTGNTAFYLFAMALGVFLILFVATFR
jgi:NADH-quinone oxidoreductase subunit L